MPKKPEWLRIPYSDNINNEMMADLLKELQLNTVCVEACCPNCSECFSKKTATFMILGTVCTRNCAFCNVGYGKPEPVDRDEPARIAVAVKKLALKYVVITSVSRDDLQDGGAAHFAAVIKAIRKKQPDIYIEVLIPDISDLKTITDESPAVISHNIETVKSLYKNIRSDADYYRSLDVLKNAKKLNPDIYTKSGIMLGLGETREEVIEAFYDLFEAGCDYLTIGQYLQPGSTHYPVCEYIEPAVFAEYRETALKIGFRHVASAPLVRSSYNAFEAISKQPVRVK